ncbi:MAG: HAD-IC family P-type ATPase, partial [Promethearchaeota archaeon]
IDTWSVVGSPTEGALMVLFQKGMGDYLLEDYKEIKEYPFDSSIKRMTKIYQKSEKHYSFTKGASEVLIPLCSKILYKNANIEFTEDLKNQVTEKVNYFAEQGYRILSLCYKEFYALPSHTDEDRDYFESDLIYLGFVTILDPPREKVKDSVESCHNAGVDVVMITGDSPKTATSISRKISIIKDENDLVCEGKDIKEMIKSPDFDKIKVFARVSPEHKQDIVNKYKEEGKVVAMTGDGVNDALALNLADAGIAMGITGTDVAKEASDMVISDDSFNSIVTGIEQGRGIFAKIRAIIVFFVCTNVFEGIAQILLYVILGLPYFFDPQYLMMWFFISIIIHALPSFGMVLDDIPKEVMDEKPKDSEEILSRNTLLLMFPFGILLAISMMTIYFISYSGLWPLFKANTEFGDLNYAYLYTVETIIPGTNLIVAKTLTMLIAVILICEVFLILQIRRPNKSLLKSILQDSNKWIFLTLGLIIFCFFALMYIPGVQTSITLNSRTFSFMFLTGEDWIVCILVSMICVGGFEIYKFICRKKGIVF